MYCKSARRTHIGASFFATIFCITILALEGCAQRQTRSVEQLGVMPIENLSPNAGLDWRSRAGPAVVAYDLAGAKNIFARAVDSLSAAQSMQASRVLEGYFFERSGRIIMRATLEDLKKARAVESFEIEGPASAGFLPLANELARRLSEEARPFGTTNENALRFFGEAMSARDSQGVEQALQAATEADPGFTAGYLDQIKISAETGDRERARQLAETARRTRVDQIDRANLEYAAATASGDKAARLRALESLSAATPANANIFAQLGEMHFARREFGQAVNEYRAATRVNPEGPGAWNELGYALARVKDLSGAREALTHYQTLEPENVNALDSEGEVSFFLGDFKAAEEYFERAAAKNSQEWLKAAEARLMTGDLRGADVLFLKHAGRGMGGIAIYQLAQWEFMTGRRKAGMDRMEKLAPGLSGDLQSLAFSQLAIWKLAIGDRRSAADLTNQAVAHAQGPQARAISAACRFIASGSTASSGSKIADALALLFARKYREALPVLQAIYAETNPATDGQVRTLLAWAYVETGAIGDAAKLLDIYPLPLSSGEPLFATLIFPRYLFVRGAVQRQEGQVDEAKKSYQLYLKLAGDMPDQFGDETKARKNIDATR